jgi:hypothetical protein
MIGSSKIDNNTDDLDRLQELFNEGLNNTQIAKDYRTNSGKQISRIHVSQIRRGKRWNINMRSFLMKNELENQNTIHSIFFGEIISTSIAQVITNKDIYHIYFTSVNDKPIFNNGGSLMMNKPTRTDLITFHAKFVNEYNRKNREGNN